MINEFQKNAAKTSSPENIKSIVRDLFGTRDDLEGQKFDVIIVRIKFELSSNCIGLTVPPVLPGIPPFLFYRIGYRDPCFLLETRRSFDSIRLS